MPLLDDAKNCFVGNTPITKVMAGSAQVWPKGTPPPVGPFDYLRKYQGTESSGHTGYFLSWETLNRPSNCSRATSYWIMAYNVPNSPPGWQDFMIFGDFRGWNWMPSVYPNCMVCSLGSEQGIGTVDFKVRYESAPGVYEYSPIIYHNPNITYPKLPTDYQQNECNGRPNP